MALIDGSVLTVALPKLRAALGVALAAGLGTLSSGYQFGLFAAAAVSAAGAVTTALKVRPGSMSPRHT